MTLIITLIIIQYSVAAMAVDVAMVTAVAEDTYDSVGAECEQCVSTDAVVDGRVSVAVSRPDAAAGQYLRLRLRLPPPQPQQPIVVQQHAAAAGGE